MDELNLTGNSLKGSRPLLVFDPAFDSEPQYSIVKDMFIDVSVVACVTGSDVIV